MTSEFSVTFSGAGGHNHDGISSTRIDTTSYSIFDFRTGVIGNNPSRTSLQQTNKISFDNYIVNLLNTREFSPTLIKIKPNSITGKILIEGSLTADKLETTLVLVKNQIKSNNFNGVIDKDNVITNNGTTGWAISSSGQSVFNNVTTRGSLVSDNGTRGTIITDGYIKGLYSAGVEFRGYTGTDYSYINGGVISTDKLSASDGTDDVSIEPGGISYSIFATKVSGSATDAVIRLERSGSAANSRFMTFAKTDGTSIGYIRYQTGNGAIEISATSDERLKNKISKIDDSLNIINSIDTNYFYWKNDINQNSYYGIFAQNVYNATPELVDKGDSFDTQINSNGETVVQSPWSINYIGLIPYLIGSIKDLTHQVISLEARLQALEGV